ncbi:hypothetical protein ALC57_14180 [Trachymyrmex cornetzi]|uniref:Nuclease HARBI1 n=1 Tax=Trachymyrmex cornetzi TaxID=471704 RepID=A0A151IYQ2_9HYME|nr:hypothetical protein ALC57_14180 [Trachymyrmex cornetzi]
MIRRRWWIRPLNRRRNVKGFRLSLFRELKTTDHEEFFSFIRMLPYQFDDLLQKIEPFLPRGGLRRPLPSELKLALTLNFLAHGDSARSKSWEFRIGRSTVYKIVQEVCEAIWKALQPISYPLSFIFSTIEQRLNFHLHNKHTTRNLQVKDKYFTQRVFVDQTKRKLSTRLHEHKSDIRKNTGSPTVITDHRINLDHNFRWNDVRILDCESSYNKRLVFEMIHIKRQKQGLNKMNDTESLPVILTLKLFNLFLLLYCFPFFLTSLLSTFFFPSTLFFPLLCTPSFWFTISTFLPKFVVFTLSLNILER